MRKSFLYIFPLLCALNSYKSGIPGISIASVLLCVYIGYEIYDSIKTNKKQEDFFSFLFLLSVIILISLIDYFNKQIESYSTIFIDYLKLIIWGSASTLLVQNCVDKIMLVRNYLLTSCVYAIYLYIQTIVYYLGGIFLPNVYSIGPLQPLYDAYSWDYQNYVEAIGMARPASFMNEPAFYSSFICITLGIILFDMHEVTIIKKHKIKFVLFFLLSIVLSTSTSGMIYAAIIILFYLAFNSNMRSYLIVSVLLLLSLTFLTSDKFLNLLNDNRLYQFTLGKLFNIKSQARIGNGISLLSSVPKNDLLLGYGYGNVKSYTQYEIINASTTILLSTGYIGLVFWIGFLGRIIARYKSKLSLLFVFLFVIASLGSGVINIQGVYYLSFACVVYSLSNNKKVKSGDGGNNYGR